MMPMRMTSRPWDNADISSSTACDFLEVYNNPRSCRKEIRQAGVAATLGGPALDALNEVYNQVAMTHGDTRSVTRQAHENFTRSLATAVNRNLNQLAEDKLWPMFWMTFHHDTPPRVPRYERDRSGEFVATFKADFGLSNADWKMFCNAGHVYLYNHFDIDFRRVRDGLHPIYVRWPRHIRLECRDTINRIQQQAPQLFPWLRELFKDEANHRIDPREFNYTVSDYCDTLGHVPQEDAVKILKAKSWNAFRQIISRLHNGNYGRSPGMIGRDMEAHMHQLMLYGTATTAIGDGRERGLTVEALQRARDMIMRDHMRGPDFIDAFAFDIGRHFIERKETKPEKLDVYTGVQSLAPSEFNAHGCECRLIDTNEKLYEEGTGMGHCIWRMYQTRIRDAKYIAYHVKYAGDPPEHKGWTLGYRLHEEPSWQRAQDEGILGKSMNPKKYEPQWKLDQIRGYKNEIPKHKALDAVAEMLLAVIRGDVKPDLYKKETK